MKKIYLLTFLFLAAYANSFAQSAEGCDGDRYLNDQFDVVSTTVQYGSSVDVFNNETPLRMDVYEPDGDTQATRPVIILAHGGSFIFGARADMASLCEDFARKGYVAATIDYRKWSIGLGFPDSLQMLDIVVKSNFDMKAAIRFMRKDAATENTFRIDPNNIIVGGLSAGGVMALNAGILDETDDIPDFVRDVIENNTVDNDYEGISGNAGYSSEVKGIINWSGGLYRVDWIDANDPPIVSMHGDNDGTVPYLHGLAANTMSINGSGYIHPRAEAMGINNYLITVPGGDHTDIYTDAQFAAAQEDWATNGMGFVNDMVCTFATSNKELADVQNQVSVFPNPSFDNMIINIGDINATYDLFVYDQLGRKIQTVFNVNDQNFNLRKSDLGAGLFVVNIVFEDKKIAPVTKRIIFE